MSQPAHTPGPWNFIKYPSHGTDRGFVIARGPVQVCQYIGTVPDGCLIAAAPVLLEATYLARDALQRLAYRMEEDFAFQAHGDARQALEKLNSAIGKYEEGRSW